MAPQLTTCTFCGVGCGLYLETDGNRITGAYPSMSHPSNEGRICVRGWHVHEVASSPDRLKSPLIRRAQGFEPASWEEALEFVARRLREIRDRHGPDACAFYNSPRCSNEESYLLQKLARAVVGTNNVDHGAGVYCNNSLKVLLEMLGLPASTNSIGELLESEVILVDSVDLGMQLPTIDGWVMRAKLKGAKLIVIDARRHRVAEHADFLLQPKPGTDILLYGAMAKVIADRGLARLPFIKAHCRDYEAFLESVGAFDLLTAAETCGVPPDLIEAAALAYANARTASIMYSTGLEFRPADSLRAMMNLVLLTGHIGRPGSGVYALTEHNNLQGVCDMGMLPDRLPGYVPVEDAAGRRRFEQAWRTPLPAAPGLSARGLLGNGSRHGAKAIWLLRYDPVTTAMFCDASAILQEFELVVVQHLFMTATAQFAHVVLPVVAFGEEQVSFTSTDRRIQLARKVIQPPSGPMPAWEQLVRVARAAGADWHYASAAEVMEEIGEVAPSYGGADHANLGREYGRQWPCTKDRPLGTRLLFEDGIPGRAFRFMPVQPPPAVRGASPDFPLALIFGNSLYYWHQNVLVKNSETLRRELRVLLLDYPEGFVEVNDQDAKAAGIRDGGKVRLVAREGSALTVARVTPEVRPGTIFVPFFVREVEKQILGHLAVNTGNPSRPVHVRIEKA